MWDRRKWLTKRRQRQRNVRLFTLIHPHSHPPAVRSVTLTPWSIYLSVSLCALLVLARVNKELAGRQGENNDLAKSIRDRLARFHSGMMDLRDALNEAVNNTARAAEINNVNEKTLEDNKVSWETNRDE